MASTRAPIGLHRLATLLAGATLALIFVGGLVTSTGSGLAVPDWPLSFGQVFPRMVGGVFYEHGHRVVAASVGALTLVLTLWAWLVETPTTVRRLALGALAVVVAQGLLGGLTVLLLLPPAISVAHACLAQAFLCLTVALALTSAPGWEDAACCPRPDDGRPAFATLTAVTAAAVYVQLIVGAVMRHTGAGLAIPDFPLALGRVIPPFNTPGVAVHFAHRLGALAVAALVAWTAAAALARHRHESRLTHPALLAAALVVVQIGLGALTIWTHKAVLPTTAHVAVGAGVLATTFLLAVRTRRLAPPRSRATVALRAREEVPA